MHNPSTLKFEVTCLGYLLRALEMMEDAIDERTKQIIENCMRNSLGEMTDIEAIEKYYDKYRKY